MSALRVFTMMATLGALMLPAWASAKDIVLPPLVSRGANSKTIMNVTSLISSELDFFSGVERVIELPKAPKALNTTCLRTTSCLRTITQGAGGDHLVAGSLAVSSSTYTLDLVLYSLNDNRVVRSKQFKLAANSEAVADGMTAVVQELMTGVSAKQQAAEDDFAFDDEDDDFEFDEAPTESESAAIAAAQAEDERLARVARDEEAKRVAAATAAAAAAAAAADEFDPDAFTFGKGSVVDEDEPEALTDLEDEEAEEERERRERSASKKRSAKGKPDDGPPKVNIYLRAGYSPYQQLSFVTYGAEVAIGLGKSGLQALAGFEIYSTFRNIPPRFTDDGEGGKEWNSMVPMNIGLAYQLQVSSVVKPYFGADFIFAQYHQDSTTNTSSWSLGGRARLGANFMLSKMVGINANLGIGYWGDDNWVTIQIDMKPAAVLFQASAGLAIAI